MGVGYIWTDKNREHTIVVLLFLFLFLCLFVIFIPLFVYLSIYNYLLYTYIETCFVLFKAWPVVLVARYPDDPGAGHHVENGALERPATCFNG